MGQQEAEELIANLCKLPSTFRNIKTTPVGQIAQVVQATRRESLQTLPAPANDLHTGSPVGARSGRARRVGRRSAANRHVRRSASAVS